MTEKVKLTKEQAEAIEKLFAFIHGEDALNLEFTGREIAEIMKYGYEVEPKFKIGDWVAFDNRKDEVAIRKIESINVPFDDGVYAHWGHGSMPLSALRHATPSEIAEEKERRWWAKHDREIWELREGDVLIHTITKITYFVDGIAENGVTLYRESTIIVRDRLKNYYQVVCFAEDRKDVS